jgi:integrase
MCGLHAQRKLGMRWLGSWNYNVDCKRVHQELIRVLQIKSRGFAKCCVVIVLTALKNSSRIEETIEAFKEFLKTSKVGICIHVKKHKKDYYRLMTMPKELIEENLTTCTKLLGKDRDVIWQMSISICQKARINTHSLRYTFITYMLRKGVSPSIIAAIMGHKNLNIILKYTKRKEAEKVLKEFL